MPTTTTTTTPNLNEQTILGTSNNIGFIGGGQMGYSISVGMAKAGKAARENIYVSDINTSRNEIFKKEGITNLYTDPKVIAKNCNIIFLCTKPHDCTSVLD
jgi:pyrroline-5-carboxylate reductase